MADIGPEQLADWARAFAAANEAGLRLGRVAIEPKAGGAPVAFALVVVAPDAPDEVRDMLVRGVHQEVYRGRELRIVPVGTGEKPW